MQLCNSAHRGGASNYCRTCMPRARQLKATAAAKRQSLKPPHPHAPLLLEGPFQLAILNNTHYLYSHGDKLTCLPGHDHAKVHAKPRGHRVPSSLLPSACSLKQLTPNTCESCEKMALRAQPSGSETPYGACVNALTHACTRAQSVSTSMEQLALLNIA